MFSLRILAGVNAGNVYKLRGKLTTIGRAAASSVQILDGRASKRHAQVRFENGAHSLLDMKSKNGTYLNGRAVKEATLKAGDRVRIGDTELVFEECEGDHVVDSAQHRKRVTPYTHGETMLISVESLNPEGGQVSADGGRAYDNQNLLHDFSLLANTDASLPQILEELVNIVFSAVGPDRMAFYLYDSKEEGYVPEVAKRRRSVQDRPFELSMKVFREVTEGKKAVHCSEVATDQRFNIRDSVVMQSINSMIGVPVLIRGQVLAIIYVDNCASGLPLSVEDFRFLTVLSTLASVVLARHLQDIRPAGS